MDAGAAMLEFNRSRVIHVHRIDCLLHLLHLSVSARMENAFFMGPLGKGSWHEWSKQHRVGLIGSTWYSMSRSDISNTT